MKKPKKGPKKKLWDIFSKYIRARDPACVTCGRVEGKMDAGHYIPAAVCGAEYYFHEKNVHKQCHSCNHIWEGRRKEYREFLVRTYGEDAVLDIEMNYHRPCPDFPYEEKIAHYKELLKQYGE